MQKPDYTFGILAPEDVDFSRVCMEAGDHEAILLMGRSQATWGKGLLILSREFLDKFSPQDRIKVAGSYLEPSWGNESSGISPHDGEISFVRARTKMDMPAGWRCAAVTDPAITAEEIQAARAHLRKYRHLSVRYLSPLPRSEGDWRRASPERKRGGR